MGRGRGKGKKLTAANHEDPLSGEEENIPIQKRRGRPQKLMKDDIDEEDGEKFDEEEDTETRSTVVTENSNGNAKKRKKQPNVKEKQDSSVKEEENSIVTATSTDTNNNLTKSNGFRHIGSRRKSTPRRAAEAGVECN